MTEGVLDLYVNEGLVRMVDDSLVYMRGFGAAPTDVGAAVPSLRISPHVFTADGRLVPSRSYPLGAALPEDGRPDPLAPHPRLPGQYLVRRAHWASFFPDRTIVAESGSRVQLTVHNRLSQAHELRIDGVASTGPVAPGASATLSFDAPAPGSYLYHDPGGGSVERILGLHGALVVVAPSDPWRLGPGLTEFERQWVWLCQDVDPVWAARARSGETIDADSTPPVPRYFMLNDRSGYRALALSRDADANHRVHEDTLPSGSAREIDVRDFSPSEPGGSSVGPGQVIRLLNAGAVVHQMHFHGNHVWTVRRNGADFPRSGGLVDADGHVILQQWEDVVELNPRDRKDVVLPMQRPPDVIDPVWDARDEDWVYPMHCHAEPSQTAAGGLYPGGLAADWTMAAPGPRRHESHPTFPSQAAFSSDQPHEGSPPTLFRQSPDKTFVRKFFSRRLRFPDRTEHEIWSFEDATSGRRFPAPLVRVTEGDLVHLRLESSKRTHTIHLHGMEPDPRNDGAGHTSFEITGSYTYQWRPARGAPGDPNAGTAGTYFYHCHVNTVLHVQMGMAGPMIIDPVVHPGFPVPVGTRRVFVDGPLYDAATEALLVPYALDPRWHTMDHAAGLSGEDVGLNRFEPRNFYVLGGALNAPRTTAAVMTPGQLRVNTPQDGYPTLLRMANFNYFPSTATFTDAAGSPVRMAEVVSHDGRAYRDTSRRGEPSPPVGMLTHKIAFGAAERYDVLVRPPAARSTYLVHIEFLHWTTGRVLAVRSVPLYTR